jgi:iron complex outermembrane receptor protein
VLTSMSARLTIVALACLISASALALADEARQVNVPAGNLIEGLESLAKQCGVDVIYPSSELKGLKTRGVSGTLEPKEAFRKLIEGTALILKEQGNALLISLPGATTRSQSGNPSDTPGADEQPQEGKSKSSGNFLLAQATPEQVPGGVSVAKPQEQTSKKKPVELEEIVVTGSRIPQTATQGPQDVQIYTREQIENSGQTTVADFLNTLPSVSLSASEGIASAFGSTTVQLRGLPAGSTLVLLNGRRLSSSGIAALGFDYFDLNNLPISAVERIEVVADGSSAIYGSDAIAGVVNVILKKDFNGVEANAKYGDAADTHEWDGNVALGKSWDRTAFSIVGSYQDRTELSGLDRLLTANNDYTSFGGPNNNLSFCSAANVFAVNTNASGNLEPLPGAPPGSGATYAGVTGKTNSGKPPFSSFNYGSLNECAYEGSGSLIPATQRLGLFAQGTFELTPSIELFSEFLYSHMKEFQYLSYQGMFGEPGFQSFTAAASNPYNPFGTSVGVSETFPSVRQGQFLDTDYLRPLVGARGSFLNSWHWEFAAWESLDFSNQVNENANTNNVALQNALNSSNPQTALNPFVSGPASSPAQIQSVFSNGLTTFSSRDQTVNTFVEGPLLSLPSGPIKLVLGGEYDRETLSSDFVSDEFEGVPDDTQATYHRTSYAAFVEARVPILANRSDPQAGDIVSLTLAGRHDHYSDFGTANTPQFGMEVRPLGGFLLRATYAEAFKAPPLRNLYEPQQTSQIAVSDPLTGQNYITTEVYGGNPALRPETGKSKSVGIGYSSTAAPDLQVFITLWDVRENEDIQSLATNYIVDNPDLFPGRVIRGPAGPNGQPGTITEVIDTFANFGEIDVGGLDYHVNYRIDSKIGTWTPSLNVTQIYKYTSMLLPGTPSVNGAGVALDSGNWAPKLKGTAALGWKWGVYSAFIDGRYVGRYQDYDSNRDIGNFWLFDGNFRYAIGEVLGPTRQLLKGVYIDVGGVNLFNVSPQFSNYSGDFVGYDATQADIRGRFLYAQIGMKF